MPELPEVETVRRGLAGRIIGLTVTAVAVLDPKVMRGESEPGPTLIGARVEAVERRAKHLIIIFDNGVALIGHLKMTGRMVYRQTASPPIKATRAIITFNEGELRFDDTRRFGFLRLLKAAGLATAPELAKLGPEPFGDAYDFEPFYRLLKDRKARIKSLLLDQTVVAGVGNIYADEVLFLAGVRPGRRACRLTRKELRRIWELIPVVLAEAIENGGSSVDDYVDAGGLKGRHQDYLKVYGKTGLPCPECGAPLQRDRIGGRSSHYCKACQR